MVPTFDVHEVKVLRTASSTELVGAPGAISEPGIGGPVGAYMWTFALDAPGVSAEGNVCGSFDVSLASPSTQMISFELQSECTGLVGPLNFKAESDGTLGPLPSPRCLSNDATGGILAVGAASDGWGNTFTVKLTETCGEEENIHVALHTGTYFSLKNAPTSIGAHETIALTIVASPTIEDTDLLVITDSEPGAMVVSILDLDLCD
jgi:hypothetical protein